ncbi:MULTISPECIES: hypothetical protein [unclassified Sphingomonas]|uniref:hypothetical protein n=1 Tax=Sphingomonas TaxID=13687 RepID=UPI000964110D|nr:MULTISPECIES: hypothetical protein [unclassified Sphingomonas]MBN8810367.1 hypothetical protein [Sphingomonas sp.]OJY50908.1 MAG: hypothetical protein BGP17_21220 [Sphingomonas sp. 67-41]
MTMTIYCQEYTDALHRLRSQYNNNYPIMATIARFVVEEMRAMLAGYHRPLMFESRVKELDSLRGKFTSIYDKRFATLKEKRGNQMEADLAAERLHRLLEHPFHHIPDAIGCRLISSYSAEIHLAGAITERLRMAFRSATNDLRGADGQEVNYAGPSGGWTGVHLRGRLTSDQAQRLANAYHELELRVEDLMRFPFEIQLRTVTVHAWTVISHERLYQVEGREGATEEMGRLIGEILQIQNDFDRLAGHADLWLDDLMDRLSIDNSEGAPLAQHEIDRLFGMRCTDQEALSAYAMYRFFDRNAYGPTNAVSPLWIRHIVRCLRMSDHALIGDVDRALCSSDAIGKVRAYRKECDALGKTNMFKDATDWLSKCLIFSNRTFQEHYPFGSETRKKLGELGIRLPDGISLDALKRL